MRGEQAIFNLEIKKKSGLSLNPDIHHSKVFSSEQLREKYQTLIMILSIELSYKFTTILIKNPLWFARIACKRMP